ncbi:MAG: hypothetical protein PHZ19_04520 [Candidatus Thermoplasmatota archaeon]|nr:hypothetical protein [Candidatus Thermoplasmatota archaeon]
MTDIVHEHGPRRARTIICFLQRRRRVEYTRKRRHDEYDGNNAGENPDHAPLISNGFKYIFFAISI